MRSALLVFALIVAGAASADSCHTPKGRTGNPACPDGQDCPSSTTSIPNVQVTTQDGKTVDFYDDLIKGKVVAVNFVFTSCTTVCPPMGAIFGKLQEQRADAHLVSVSIDPEVDTPERLKSWSRKFGARPGWTLVTGRKDDIVRLLKAMNAYSPDFANHQPVTIVGNDATGTWKRAYGFTNAAKLAVMLRELESGS